MILNNTNNDIGDTPIPSGLGDTITEAILSLSTTNILSDIASISEGTSINITSSNSPYTTTKPGLYVSYGKLGQRSYGLATINGVKMGVATQSSQGGDEYDVLIVPKNTILQYVSVGSTSYLKFYPFNN